MPIGKLFSLKASALPVRHKPAWAARLIGAFAVLVGFILIASAGYFLIEREYTWLESLYMTVITITTVGYQEVHPLSQAGRIWTVLVIIGGLTTGAVVLSMIVAMVVEGRVRTIFGRRLLDRKINNLTGHVIVCGYGGMGSLAAAELTAAGREVVVIDTDPERTELAGAAKLLYVLGDAQDENVLNSAGLARASALVAALPTDAENLFVTLTARQLNPNVTIIARALNAPSQTKMQRAGANRVICPQVIGAMRMAEIILRPAVVDFVEMAHQGVDLEMDQLVLGEDSTLVGKTLRDLALPKRLGVQVVAVRRAGGQTLYHPGAELQLQARDTLVLVGPRGAASAVERFQAETDQT